MKIISFDIIFIIIILSQILAPTFCYKIYILTTNEIYFIPIHILFILTMQCKDFINQFPYHVTISEAVQGKYIRKMHGIFFIIKENIRTITGSVGVFDRVLSLFMGWPIL